MLVTLVQNVGNKLKILVMLKVLSLLCNFILGNKLGGLFSTINWWSDPKYNIELILQWKSDFKFFLH